jgi:hypothetical protein
MTNEKFTEFHAVEVFWSILPVLSRTLPPGHEPSEWAKGCYFGERQSKMLGRYVGLDP